MNLREQRNKVAAELRLLKAFTNSLTVRRLRRELQQRLQEIEAKIERQERAAKKPPSRKEIRLAANAARVGKLRRYHNYIRQIRNNYPDLTYSEIRSQLTERKRGKKTSIPDVIWKNPSP